MAESGWLTLPAGISDLIEKGYGFYYNTAAAGVAAAVCGTASAPMLWNPSDSDVRLKILRIRYGGVSGTVILAHIAYGLFLNCGSQIGTAQPIVSHTLVAAVNAVPGAGRASKIRFAPATVSMTGGPSYFMPNGLSSGGALAAGPLYKLVDDVNGEIIINPGNAFFPYVSNGALALTAAVSVFALELPISTPVY
jgi:hypothetical protein